MFKVGDIVECCGTRGVVDVVKEENFGIGLYSIAVVFPGFPPHSCIWFDEDGRRAEWETIPSLQLIERPKQKVTKEVTGKAIVKRSDGSYAILTEPVYDVPAWTKRHGDEFILVELKGTYEIEE